MARFTKLYVEGGGNQNKALASRLRGAFSDFLKKSDVKQLPRIVACGGRQEAYKDFCIANGEDGYPMLLVDSEGPVTTPDKWGYLRHSDNWERPEGAQEEQCQLMVQQMESWFLGDKEALGDYFGEGFKVKNLPQSRDIESIDRGLVMKALVKASSKTKRGPYQKGAHQCDILEKLNPHRVRVTCPHCECFLTAFGKS